MYNMWQNSCGIMAKIMLDKMRISVTQFHHEAVTLLLFRSVKVSVSVIQSIINRIYWSDPRKKINKTITHSDQSEM